MKKSKYLETAIKAAKEAEKIILKYYKKKNRISLKKDLSPVSIADQKAEEAIIKTIRAVFPEHNILGEEGGDRKKQSEFTWIIDPIDGTKSYLRHIPLFATEIALMKSEEIIVGVSNAPALKEFLYAEKGKGAFCNDKKILVSNIDKLFEAYFSFGGLKYFKRADLISQLVSLSKSNRGFRGIGEFWSYHLLAQGKIDVMIEACGTKIWDFAALTLIVKEAGGKVTDINGNDINIKTDSIIATNGKLHQKIVDRFKKIN
ncbi:MAG: inositol monophosphatase [Candidatus Woesebacteria bacterium]|jgi:histidinol-phosphatase